MRRFPLFVLCLFGSFAAGSDADETWFDVLLRWKERPPTAEERTKAEPLPSFGDGNYTFSVWINTKRDGSIFAKAAPAGEWVEGGKSLFIRDGHVCYDIGWVGCLEGDRLSRDGEWHHVAFCGGCPQRIYIDGELAGQDDMETTPDRRGHVLKLGYTSTDFPEGRQPSLSGLLDDARVYARVLSPPEIRSLAEGSQLANGLVAHWPFEGDARDASGCKNHASPTGDVRYEAGKFGQAVRLGRAAYLVVPCDAESRDVVLWRELAAQFGDDDSIDEMTMEREDGIWTSDWKTASYGEIAKRYAAATVRPTSLADRIAKLAADAATADDIRAVRALYLKSRQYERLLETIAEFQLKELRQSIQNQYGDSRKCREFVAQIDSLEKQSLAWNDGAPDSRAFLAWKDAVRALRHKALFEENPLINFNKLVFIRRYTFQSSHFYTDFIDGCVHFGGNLSVLDLKAGEVHDLIPDMSEGIFGRFDLHFSGRKVVFDWKAAPESGFRIYEIEIDPNTGTRTSGPRQLTFPPPDEQARIRKFAHPNHTPGPGAYYHQTDDMHPCYLPDGGIAFTSTRCEFGTLCDAPDILSTPVIHRIDGDGRNMQKLTNSPVSEFCPTMTADGRILYTRWEYVDKGQLGVKCLWTMRLDGSGTAETYGNDIPFPPSMMYGREIPGETNLFVFAGAPHYPQGGSFGPIIRIDMAKDIRTKNPMTYITPHVDVRQEPGWNHLRDGKWVRDQNGPLYSDPYPLSKNLFLVSHNPDQRWNHVSAYGLYLLDDNGNHQLIYKDPEFTCRQPFPLQARGTPPVLVSPPDPQLAEKNLALCFVADVHRGMNGIKPGEVRYLRIMEQLPRPWDARRFWDPNSRFDNHTALISMGTALAGKVMWGVVPVEKDGSAYFFVPADRNIYFQALDDHYMELQRERTYVNYRPGETRSCVGCHEKPNEVMGMIGEDAASLPLAMTRPARMPQAQPGDQRPEQVIHYPSYVQPVLDQFCVECHGQRRPKDDLDLTGALTTLFSRSYENLMERGMVKTSREASDFDGTEYYPPKTIGSHASPFMRQVREGCTGMDAPLPLWAQVRLATWVDAAGVYYGSYWGRRHIEFRDHPNFRPVPTFEEAISTVCPVPMSER